MKILVANLGSTSFKYRLFDMADERQLARGGVERVGSAESPMFVEIDDDTQAIVAQLMRDHPKLVDTTKGRSGADPFVISLAATTNPAMTVVTEEALGKSRIPDVCNAQKILWCGVADLIEKEDWRSRK